MAVKMRLRRMGSRNAPFYRIVVQDARRAPTGWYDPKQEGLNFSLNVERVDYWISNGAQPSETVNSFIKKAKTVSNKNSISASIPEEDIPQNVIVEETKQDEEISTDEEDKNQLSEDEGNESSENSEEN